MHIVKRMGRPTRLALVWYRRLGIVPPMLETHNTLLGDLARLVPYRFRRFHHAYATAFWYYWLPCPACGNEHGGHEGGMSIPDPVEPDSGQVICSQCTIERNKIDMKDGDMKDRFWIALAWIAVIGTGVISFAALVRAVL